MELNVVEKSHSYWIDCRDQQVKMMVRRFLASMTSKKMEVVRGVKNLVYDQTFAAKSPCGNYIGMLKPAYELFVSDLMFSTGVKPAINLTVKPPSDNAKVEFKIKDGISFKDDEQESAYNFTQQDMPMHIIEAKTGFGKTFLGIYTSAKMQTRTMFIMQAKHIKTWLADLDNFIDIEKTDVGIIRGRESIVSAVELQKQGKYNPKFIFVSSETFREYIKAYESEEEYVDVTPEDFCEFFNVGRVVRDEAHEALYTLVKQTLYLNVKNVLCLSATIVSEDKFMSKMYELTFPKKYRWKSSNNKHIEAFSVRYRSDNGLKVASSTGYGYSHIKYEKSIMKKPYLRDQYVNMILEIADEYAIDYKPGMKLIVFCSMIETCEYVTKELQKKFKDLEVNTFVGKTKEEVLYNSDVIVTTPGACGTGVNIINLSHSINTVAIGSKKLAWQLMGRLRPIKKYPDISPKFYFLSNMSLAPHRKFEQTRRYDLLDKTKSLKSMDIGMKLRKWGY